MKKLSTREAIKDLEKDIYIADNGEEAYERREEFRRRKHIGSNRQPKKKKRK